MFSTMYVGCASGDTTWHILDFIVVSPFQVTVCQTIFLSNHLQDSTDIHIQSQQTQNICITFIQRRPNVLDVGPTLYKCYTNVLCLLWCSYGPSQCRYAYAPGGATTVIMVMSIGLPDAFTRLYISWSLEWSSFKLVNNVYLLEIFLSITRMTSSVIDICTFIIIFPNITSMINSQQLYLRLLLFMLVTKLWITTGIHV